MVDTARWPCCTKVQNCIPRLCHRQTAKRLRLWPREASHEIQRGKRTRVPAPPRLAEGFPAGQPGRGRGGSLQQPPGLGLRPPGNRGAPAAEGLLALARDPIVTGRHAVLRGSRGHRRGVPRVTPSWRPGRSRVLQPPTPGLWRAAPFSLTSARPAPNTGCKRPQTQAAKRKATFPTREQRSQKSTPNQ